MRNAIIPDHLLDTLLLEDGESPLASWGCLLSMEEKQQRRKELAASIAMAPLTGGASLAYSPTLKGHLVLTDRRVAFVEDSLVGSRHVFDSAIKLEQITDITTTEELIIEAESLGWKWCLRGFEVEGFTSVPADLRSVADLLRKEVIRRKSEIDTEKEDRRKRIESFEQERHKGPS